MSEIMEKCFITLSEARKIAKKLGINLKVVSIDEWRYGMCVELEYGRARGLTNVTDNNLLKTGKIALAHILEYPDYYKRLYKMEEQAEKYWKKKKIPKVLID